MACKFISWAIKAGASLQMYALLPFTHHSYLSERAFRRTQLHISNYLIYALDSALQRVLDAHPVIDPLHRSADSPDLSKPLSPSKVLTKIKSSERQIAPLICEESPTFSSAQVAAPADACVWPVASKQLAAVAVLDTLLRGLTDVLNACDTGVAGRIAAHDWSMLAANLRALIQRGKYYDLPQLKHKNVQSDATTAAALQLLAACVRARCNHLTIVEDSSFLEAIFGIMNNPGATGPNAALAVVLELAKLPDTQRAISSTFGYMTGTKAGASWRNSVMSKMSREIKRLCASEGSPPSKSGAKATASFMTVQHDAYEDEDSPSDEPLMRSPLLPPISSGKSSRASAKSPSSRVPTAATVKASPLSSPNARVPAPAPSSPAALSSRGLTGSRGSKGVKSPAALVLPALS